MRKPTIISLSLVALVALLTLTLPALAGKKKQAKESLRNTIALLGQTADTLDEMAEDAGLDIRSADMGKKDGAKPKMAKKEKPSRQFKEVRRLVSRLYDFSKLLRTELRQAGKKKKSKRVKKLRDELKQLKARLKTINREKPERDMNALREVEAAAERIQAAATKAANVKSKKAKIGRRIREVLTGRSDRHKPAMKTVENLQSLAGEMRTISESLRDKKSPSAPRDPRAVLTRYAGDLRSEANTLLRYWEGEGDGERTKLARALIRRIDPLDRAIKKTPKKPGKGKKALDKLDAALHEVIDGHSDEIDILAWSWGNNP